jgi:hypothetical protein
LFFRDYRLPGELPGRASAVVDTVACADVFEI